MVGVIGVSRGVQAERLEIQFNEIDGREWSRTNTEARARTYARRGQDISRSASYVPALFARALERPHRLYVSRRNTGKYRSRISTGLGPLPRSARVESFISYLTVPTRNASAPSGCSATRNDKRISLSSNVTDFTIRS